MSAEHPRDLGLSWTQAAHGVQTATAHEQNLGSDSGSPKHLRTGVNIAMADLASLTRLMVAKGVITWDEYREAARLGMNEELARHQDEHPGITFR